MKTLVTLIESIRQRVEQHVEAWKGANTRSDLIMHYGRDTYLTALVAVSTWADVVDTESENHAKDVYEMIISETLTAVRYNKEEEIPGRREDYVQIGNFFYALQSYEEMPEHYRTATDWSDASNLIRLRNAVEAIMGIRF